MSEVKPSTSEAFSFGHPGVYRVVKAGRLASRSRLESITAVEEARDAWDRAVLRGVVPQFEIDQASPLITVADVFCGAGGLSRGILDCCSALGLRSSVAFGADQDLEALSVFSSNLRPSTVVSKNVSALVDYVIEGQAESASFAYPPYLLDPSLEPWEGRVTVLAGGPPCQGHSSLNNRTRGEDPRNLLYLAVPALAVALKVQAVVIENVQEVRRDRQSVFATASSLLASEGYDVSHILMGATQLGVPQTRRRLFLIATKGAPLNLVSAYRACGRPPRSCWYGIEDLEMQVATDTFSSPAAVDAVSQSRIDYLFDHDLFELPNDMRPDCHKEGHSYPSVYGRLRKDLPAGTVTQGFNTIGRGRFIHPTQRRPITPQEAARLQGFPDTFSWNRADGNSWPRSTYAKLIGNAVPPQMGYAAMLAILASLYPQAES